MRLGQRLGPDVVDPHLREGRRREDRRFHVGADPDHGVRNVGRSQRGQRGSLGAVGGPDVGEAVPVAIDQLVVHVHPEDLVAHVHQLPGERRPEPSQTDHQHGLLVGAGPGRKRAVSSRMSANEEALLGKRKRRRRDRSTRAVPSVAGPTRPMNMSTTTTSRAGSDSAGVSPVLRPTWRRPTSTRTAPDSSSASVSPRIAEGSDHHRGDADQRDRRAHGRISDALDPTVEQARRPDHRGSSAQIAQPRTANVGDLDAAAGGGVPGTDEHQRIGDEQGGRLHGPDVDRVEPRRSGHDTAT